MAKQGSEIGRLRNKLDRSDRARIELVKQRDAARALAARYREALEQIARFGECENYTRPPYCRDGRSGRIRTSDYGAERWCDSCLTRAALAHQDGASRVSAGTDGGSQP